MPLLSIEVKDTNPDRAAAVANSLAEALIAAAPTVQGREETFIQSIEVALADTEATDRVDRRTRRRAGRSRSTDRGPGRGAQDARAAARRPAVDVRDVAGLLVGGLLEPYLDRRECPPLDRYRCAPDAAQHAARGGHRRRRDLRRRVRRRAAGRYGQGLGDRPGGHRPEHPGHDRPAQEPAWSQRDLSAGGAALPSIERGGGVSRPAVERRVRLGRCPRALTAGDELDPGRGQDDDVLQPGGRVRTGWPASPARRCRPPPARRPRDVRHRQHRWPDHPAPRIPGFHRQRCPGHRGAEPAGDHHGPAAAQPGRAAGVDADARRDRESPGAGGPRGVRQPAGALPCGRRGAQLTGRRHAGRGCGRTQPPTLDPDDHGDPAARRGKRAGRRAQPRPGEVGAWLRRLLRQPRGSGRCGPASAATSPGRSTS